MPSIVPSSNFIQFLIKFSLESKEGKNGGGENLHLPSLSEISKELGISIASLREQLEVAKAIGLVEVKPRTGIRKLAYSFFPAVSQSLSYAISIDFRNFLAFADLRNHVESAYWYEATKKLTSEDHHLLQNLISNAWKKLKGHPIQIPHVEHKELHLSIFRKLQNPFVIGLLEAYWQAYESVGLNVYADYSYHEQVWKYHQEIVDAICEEDYERGYKALVEHKDLLFHRTYSSEFNHNINK